MTGKIQRSWHLVKSSARVLSSAPDLVVLPILGTLGSIAVAAAIYFGVAEPLGLQNIFNDQASTQAETETFQAEQLIVLFLFYVSTAFVMTFFNVALASAALARLRGEHGGVGSGIACAARNAVPILGYSAFVAVLGIIQKFLRDRGGMGGRIASGLLGLAARVATFLVTPVIAAEEVGPVEAVRRSASLLRSTWGENLVGSTGLSLVFLLVNFAILAIAGGVAFLLMIADTSMMAVFAVISIAGVAVFAVTVIWTTLAGIYKASVYAYAVNGTVPEGFQQEEMAQAFRQKGTPAPA